jgi:NhaA family Na+:H+ antiporter
MSTPRKLLRIIRPFQEFFHTEALGGLLLLAFTILALLWANSPWAANYSSLWQTKLTFGVGSFELSKPLLLWINDGLMAIFFFLVGLEIKREILVGELASIRKATLPIAAALGGVLVPAIIYSLINAGGEGARGWGIPLATDIAFALGVMALLGKRIPDTLKVLLTALAIADDITAVLIIVVFYTSEIVWGSLAIGFGFLLLLLIANRLHIRHGLIYAILGVGLWLALLKSGVHATVAGILLAMMIPARTAINPSEFLQNSRENLDIFEEAEEAGESIMTNEIRQAAVYELDKASKGVQSPLQRMEHALHSWVAFFIMPVFALANAGVALGQDFDTGLTQPITLGVILGLLVGKPLGITLASWLAVRIRLADKPDDIRWWHIHGMGWLAGIGFTMALFIAGLAFEDRQQLSQAKAGIMVASLLSGLIGSFILSRIAPVRAVASDVT